MPNTTCTISPLTRFSGREYCLFLQAQLGPHLSGHQEITMRTIAVFLALSAVAFGSQPAVTDTPTQPKTSTPQWHSPAVPQKASGGFWRVDHTFKSTIALTNIV
jgi:hypothetical protein